MARDDHDREDIEFERQLERARDHGFSLPVRAPELAKAWRRTQPVETSAAFDQTVAQLLDGARNRPPGSVGCR